MQNQIFGALMNAFQTKLPNKVIVRDVGKIRLMSGKCAESASIQMNIKFKILLLFSSLYWIDEDLNIAIKGRNSKPFLTGSAQ